MRRYLEADSRAIVAAQRICRRRLPSLSVTTIQPAMGRIASPLYPSRSHAQRVLKRILPPASENLVGKDGWDCLGRVLWPFCFTGIQAQPDDSNQGPQKIADAAS